MLGMLGEDLKRFQITNHSKIPYDIPINHWQQLNKLNMTYLILILSMAPLVFLLTWLDNICQ